MFGRCIQGDNDSNFKQKTVAPITSGFMEVLKE